MFFLLMCVGFNLSTFVFSQAKVHKEARFAMQNGLSILC